MDIYIKLSGEGDVWVAHLKSNDRILFCGSREQVMSEIGAHIDRVVEAQKVRRRERELRREQATQPEPPSGRTIPWPAPAEEPSPPSGEANVDALRPPLRDPFPSSGVFPAAPRVPHGLLKKIVKTAGGHEKP